MRQVIDLSDIQSRLNALEVLLSKLVAEVATERPDPLQCVNNWREEVFLEIEAAKRQGRIPTRFHHAGTLQAIDHQFDAIEKCLAELLA